MPHLLGEGNGCTYHCNRYVLLWQNKLSEGWTVKRFSLYGTVNIQLRLKMFHDEKYPTNNAKPYTDITF